MLSFNLSFSTFFHYLHHLGDRHLTMILVVDRHHRSQGTGAETIHPLQCEQSVLGRLAVLNTEFVRHRIGNAAPALEVTGRTQANTNDVLSPRL